MSPDRTKENAGWGPGAQEHQLCDLNPTTCAAVVNPDDCERSAENWLLDAATYARDGDHAHAILAAKRGIAQLERVRC